MRPRSNRLLLLVAGAALLLPTMIEMPRSVDAEDEAESTAPALCAVAVVDDLAYYDGPDSDAESDAGESGPAFHDKKHRLDLFLPTEPDDDTANDDTERDSDRETVVPASPPLLMFIHGGGWLSGDRKLYTELGNRLAERGIAAALISYRLTPEVLFPEHIEDAARAFAWLRANADEYGYDADAMFIAGHSAGGHSCALLALDTRYLDAHDLEADEVIAGAIPMSGVYTVGLNLFGAFSDDADTWTDATATTHARETAFPIMLVHGDRDGPGLALDAWGLERALERVDAEVTRHELDNRNHFTVITEATKRDDVLLNLIVEFVHDTAAAD